VTNPLIGAWTLRSALRKLPATGKTEPLWGEHPGGTLIYTAEGRMMALVLAEGRQAPADIVATDAEAAALFRTMVAYSGRYTVEAERVIHHVENSWNEKLTGTDIVRFYEIDGTRLTLTTAPAPNPRDGKMSVSTMVWERLA
jgi:hypothetical protein